MVQKLCEFLEVKLTQSQLKSVIEWCSFNNMKQNPSVNYEWYKTMGLFKKEGKFFRKGQVGDWLNHYSKSESIALDDQIKKNLSHKIKFNYGISEDDLKKIHSR